MRWLTCCLTVLVSSACVVPPAQVDAGADAAVETPDAMVVDAGAPDAGSDDAGDIDAGLFDAGGPADAGPDAGSVDSGASDSGAADAGLADAGSTDAGRDAGIDAGALGPDGCLLGEDAGTFIQLRAVAANLTTGGSQTWDPGHGLRILQGIRPDLVMIQEFNVASNTTQGTQAFVDALSADAGFQWWRGQGAIPNGVISRWPIIEAGDWTDPQVNNRTFAWAHVDLPGPRDLWVVSIHFLTTGSGARAAEANALIDELANRVPTRDFLLIGGDFNTQTRGENCINVLEPRAETGPDMPTDQLGNDGTNAARNRPYDRVLTSQCLIKYAVPTVAGAVTLDGGLVVDTRTHVPLTEIAPAVFGDSSANNMQHMAIVKDFLIPQ